MNRRMRWVVVLAGFTAGVMFFAVQPAEAGWRHAESSYASYASYEGNDGYDDYPAVGSDVDRYDHAAAAGWSFRCERHGYQTLRQTYYRSQLPRVTYRR